MGLNEKFFGSATGRPFDSGAAIWLDAANPDSYDGTGSTWYDLSDTTRNGTINGATWSSGGYFDFDGTNDWIQTSYVPASVTGFSTAMWINADAVGYNKSISGFWLNGGGRIDYMLNSEASNTSNINGNIIQFKKTDFIGNWNHVAVSMTNITAYNTGGSYASAITAKIYYNGALVNTVYPTPYQSAPTGMRFGRSGFGYYYDGQMSKAVVYESALTASEILALYQEPR